MTKTPEIKRIPDIMNGRAIIPSPENFINRKPGNETETSGISLVTGFVFVENIGLLVNRGPEQKHDNTTLVVFDKQGALSLAYSILAHYGLTPTGEN